MASDLVDQFIGVGYRKISGYSGDPPIVLLTVMAWAEHLNSVVFAYFV